jgi:hypothetical protein
MSQAYRILMRKTTHQDAEAIADNATSVELALGHTWSVPELKSVLERDLPSSREAEQTLGALRGQARDFGVACALSLAGAVIAVVVDTRLALALAAAATAMLILCGRSIWRRRELLVTLLGDRDAYSIDAVRRRASRFATTTRRHRLGGWLREVVAVADGEMHAPSTSVRVIDARVRPRRERLLKLADALEDDVRSVHPASVALLHQVLTRPGLSPLYNLGFHEDLLDLALHRVEAGIEPHL